MTDRRQAGTVRSPLDWLAMPAGFVAGTALQLQQAALFHGAVYGAMLVGVLLALGWRGRRPVRRSVVPVLLLTALLGFAGTGLRAVVFLETALDPALEGRDIVLTGQVLAMPQIGEEGLRFRFAVESALIEGRKLRLPPQVQLGWYAGFGVRELPGGASLLELQRQPQEMRAGERWVLTVRLKAPHGTLNPGGFDQELWLWEQGLQATGYMRTGKGDAPPQKISDSRWAHPVERARQSVREAIYQRVADRQRAGLLAALVVGDQNAIERADWDVFRATGVAHLMSISLFLELC